MTIITVTFRSASVLPGFLDAIAGKYPVMAVDNGPDDGGRDILRRAGASVVVPDQNLGFGAGCNLGAAGVTSEFLLFLNPDARLTKGAITSLKAAAKRHPEAAGFGPDIRLDDGASEYKRASILTPDEPLLPEDPGNEDRAVSTLSGAALFLRNNAFRAIGGFDPQIFMYFEDDDISLRLRQGWGELYLVPSAQVRHLSGKSTPPSKAMLRFKGFHWSRSYIHVASRYGLPSPWMSGFKDAISPLREQMRGKMPDGLHISLGRLRGTFSALLGR